MDYSVFLRSILVVAEKNMRIYYFKGPVVVFGLLFPFLMFTAFFIGRSLDIKAFFPGFLGMMLFFTASSVGPLITPWEKREKTYERLVSLPVILESIIAGDILAGAVFGFAISLVVFLICMAFIDLAVADTIVFIIAMFLGSITFAALGTLLASPTTDNPSNIMMLSSLVRLPLIFISGIFIPLGELSGWLFVLSSLSPLTYLVDLLNSAFGNSAVYPAWLDIFVILAVIFAFVFLTKIIQKRNLVKGV